MSAVKVRVPPLTNLVEDALSITFVDFGSFVGFSEANEGTGWEATAQRMKRATEAASQDLLTCWRMRVINSLLKADFSAHCRNAHSILSD
jgi:hypothetical protein